MWEEFEKNVSMYLYTGAQKHILNSWHIQNEVHISSYGLHNGKRVAYIQEVEGLKIKNKCIDER